MLLTTLEYGYICLVGYWLHWSTDTFVLYCSWLHRSTDTFVLSCIWLHWSTHTFVLSCSWLHWSTDTFVLFCSWLHWSMDTFFLFCSWLHWSTDTFVLFCSWLHGVRIQLYCMLLRTLEYEYICLVLFVTTRGTDTFVWYVTDYTGVRTHLSFI